MVIVTRIILNAKRNDISTQITLFLHIDNYAAGVSYRLYTAHKKFMTPTSAQDPRLSSNSKDDISGQNIVGCWNFEWFHITWPFKRTSHGPK